MESQRLQVEREKMLQQQEMLQTKIYKLQELTKIKYDVKDSKKSDKK